MNRLKRDDILRVVHDYIGVTTDHYLWGFNYSSHEDFYARYCGLPDIDVAAARARFGSTKKTFIGILEDASPGDQAKILRGVLEYLPIDRFPVDDREPRRQAMVGIESMLARLGGAAVPLVEDLLVQSQTVERAIADAALLISERGATSGTDRVHTSLHGYIRAVCAKFNVVVASEATMAAMMKALRVSLPAMQIQNPRQGDVATVLHSMSAILDALDPIRNRASVAHPNEHLLEQPEALLVIDAARTIVNYVNRKLKVS